MVNADSYTFTDGTVLDPDLNTLSQRRDHGI